MGSVIEQTESCWRCWPGSSAAPGSPGRGDRGRRRLPQRRRGFHVRSRATTHGTYFINYFGFYSAQRFKGNDGDNLFPFGGCRFSNTFRLIHITDKKLLGGYWGMHIFIPLVKMDVHTSPGSGSREGLGDIIVDPFILSWHGKNWRLLTALDIYCPTGEVRQRQGGQYRAQLLDLRADHRRNLRH